MWLDAGNFVVDANAPQIAAEIKTVFATYALPDTGRLLRFGRPALIPDRRRSFPMTVPVDVVKCFYPAAGTQAAAV